MKSDQSLEDILAKAEEICKSNLAPGADEVDFSGEWPAQQIHALLDAGLGGLVIPAEVGGLGHGLFSVAKVCEVLGRECASTAHCFGMHLVGSAVISKKATNEQKEKFLVPVANGKHLTTLSLSEPGTGSHFYIPKAELSEGKDGGYILNGTKSFIANGNHADSYVVSAVIPDPETPIGRFSCVVVPGDAEKVTWNVPCRGLGLRGNSAGSMVVNNLSIPATDLLGEPGDQIWYAFEVAIPYFITAMAGTFLGIATATLREATNHLKKGSDSQFGTTLSQQPVLQHRIGVLWAMVERTRRLLYSAAKAGDQQTKNSLLSLFSAKAEVSESAVNVVNEVMTLMGDIAYASKGKLSRYLRDARASHVMAPTTDQLRVWTGRHLLDLPLLGDQ